MKKLFLLALMALTFNLAYSVNVDSIQITQAERIIDKYSEKVSNSLTSLVDSLEEPAIAIFETVVRLQIAKGVGYLLILIPLVVFTITMSKYYNIMADAKDKYPNRHYDILNYKGGTFFIVSLIGFIFSFIIAIPAVYYGILYLFAPEWFAILELSNLFK